MSAADNALHDFQLLFDEHPKMMPASTRLTSPELPRADHQFTYRWPCKARPLENYRTSAIVEYTRSNPILRCSMDTEDCSASVSPTGSTVSGVAPRGARSFVPLLLTLAAPAYGRALNLNPLTTGTGPRLTLQNLNVFSLSPSLARSLSFSFGKNTTDYSTV